MKAPIIEISCYSFACKSIAKATELAKLLSELTLVERKNSADYRTSYYEEADSEESDPLRVKLLVSKEVRKKPARLALPSPKRGAIRCECGSGTVLPGEYCPSCNLSYNAILMARST